MTENTLTPEEENAAPSPLFLVKEFMTVFEQDIRDEPTGFIPERIERSNWLLEEASELWEADRDNDLVEIADALGDIIYIAYGCALAHGLDLLAPYGGHDYSPAEVLRIIYTRQHKKIKPKPTLHVMTRRNIVSGIQKSVIAYSNYILKAGEDVDPAILTSMLTSIVSAVYFASFAYGIPLDDVLTIIQASNMSKLGEDGLPVKREDGKVLKGPNFFEPQDLIKGLLMERGWKG